MHSDYFDWPSAMLSNHPELTDLTKMQEILIVIPSFEYQLEPWLQLIILVPLNDYSEQQHTTQWHHPVQSEGRPR